MKKIEESSFGGGMCCCALFRIFRLRRRYQGHCQGRSRRGESADRLYGAQRKLKQSCHSRF